MSGPFPVRFVFNFHPTMVSLCTRLFLEKRETLSSEVREKLVTGSKEEALARAGTKYVPEKSKLPTGAIVWLKFDRN